MAKPGKLISYTLIHSFSKDDVKNIWKEKGIPRIITPVKNGFDMYEVMYSAEYVDGQEVMASGFYYVPSGLEEPLPLLAYHHGTRIEKDRSTNIKGENLMCALFAADGYLVAAPDYFGLGKGERTHLYMHAESEAQATVDFLRALEELNREVNANWNRDRLFLTGYSQGGHASMSAHKYIQEEFSDEFSVTASAPLSGAYDLTGSQSEVMFEPYSHPGYLPYLYFSYCNAYGIYTDDPLCAIKPPLDEQLPQYFDGRHSMGDVNRVMPDVPAEMFYPDVLEEYLTDTASPLKAAIADNNVHDWAPEAPMLLCYCNGDEQVAYTNSVSTHETMTELGAENINLKQVSEVLDHRGCAPFAIMYTKYFFDSIRKGSETGRKGPLFKRWILKLGMKQEERKYLKKQKDRRW